MDNSGDNVDNEPKLSTTILSKSRQPTFFPLFSVDKSVDHEEKLPGRKEKYIFSGVCGRKRKAGFSRADCGERAIE